jgi:hypothetical protein
MLRTKRKYITIHEGYTAHDAVPIFATSDEAVIQAAVRELFRRLSSKADKIKETKPRVDRFAGSDGDEK